jgi:hypothetical protein
MGVARAILVIMVIIILVMIYRARSGG